MSLALLCALASVTHLKPARVRLGGIAAHDENQIGIFDVDPVIRHRSTAKRRGKTCHRRTVSHTRLIIECQETQ